METLKYFFTNVLYGIGTITITFLILYIIGIICQAVIISIEMKSLKISKDIYYNLWFSFIVGCFFTVLLIIALFILFLLGKSIS